MRYLVVILLMAGFSFTGCSKSKKDKKNSSTITLEGGQGEEL